MIRLEHISKRFEAGKQTVDAIKDVSLCIEKGTIAGIIGFSGAGKSTLTVERAADDAGAQGIAVEPLHQVEHRGPIIHSDKLAVLVGAHYLLGQQEKVLCLHSALHIRR